MSRDWRDILFGGGNEKGNREVAGCGHGECTAEGVCKYNEGNSVVVGQALEAIEAGQVGRVRLGGPDAVMWRRHELAEGQPVRWHPSDLDRCEHGRHSADSCLGCLGGVSSGNVFLSGQTWTRTVEGVRQVRIGTMVDGEPIWVTPNRRRTE